MEKRIIELLDAGKKSLESALELINTDTNGISAEGIFARGDDLLKAINVVEHIAEGRVGL